MLRQQSSIEEGRRNEIVGATDRTLTLRVKGREVMAFWSTVTGVSAGIGKLYRRGDRWILVLAIDVRLPDQEHLLIVGEIEPAWVPLTTNLHIAPPDVAPFEVWGAQLIAAPAPILLYQRGAQL